jgi:hypothetical protein
VTRALAVLLGAVAVGARCAGGDEVDIDAAAAFQRFPIYWLTEEFEGHELTHISELGETNPGATLVYGTCDRGSGLNGGSAPPLQIQQMPLCSHLDAATRNPIWRTREVRGAPVGSLDDAPLLFTQTRQVKVYLGQGSSRGMALRALELLHSLNDVEPFIPALGPIPPPPQGVLEGDVPCTG